MFGLTIGLLFGLAVGWILAMIMLRATYHLTPKMMSEAEAEAFFNSKD